MTLRIVLTGSESTGKTTLAGDLARHFGTLVSPEYSRIYAEMTRRPLTADDVEPIARGQIAIEEEHVRLASGLLFHDTDLVSTLVYANHYYGECPEWIASTLRSRHADLYLLMDIDVPWIADPARDRGDRREEIHRLFGDALERLGARYLTVSGDWETRRWKSIDAVEALLAKGSSPPST